MVPIIGSSSSVAPSSIATELGVTDYTDETKRTVTRVFYLTDPFRVILNKQIHLMYRNMKEDHRLQLNGRGKKGLEPFTGNRYIKICLQKRLLDGFRYECMRGKIIPNPGQVTAVSQGNQVGETDRSIQVLN